MTERTTGRLLTVLAMAILAALVALCAYIKPAETLPGGFSDVKVTDSHFPTALAFTPDGRMVVAGKSGQVYLYDKSGNNLAKPQAMTLPVCDNSERGLLGVAVDPEFGTAGNNYVYLYYTHKRSVCPDKQPADPRNPYNRVSRFQMNGDTIDRTSEEVLVDGIPSPNGNHNAGDLHFGKDGKLYVSVGDGACDYAEKTKCQYENDASRDENVLLGKILRLKPDGTIPADNPFTGTNSARCSNESGGIARAGEGQRCQETFVSGFRNPFRFAIDPDAEGTRLFINDVGGQRWEEVDEAVFGANSGDDYGWNVCEGRHDNPYRAGQENCDSATKTAPIHEYNHSTGCESVTAGAFVPNDARWPDGYRDAYLYGDFVCGRIFSLKPQDGGYARTTFAGGLRLRSAVAMDFGPYKSTRKALYYATFEDGGMIRRISYEGGNQDPIAELQTDDGKNYSPDLTMTFDASGSTDAEGQALSYEWDFGDGEKQTTTAPKVTHEYKPHVGQAARGEYQVSVTVKDTTTGVSDPPARLTVYPGDTPPDRPSITSPADESTFAVPPKDGETVRANITATGSASDPDGDTVTLEWEVVQHHDANHAHPYATGTGDSFMFPGAEPEGLYSTDPQGNYLEVRLIARDSLGLASEPTTIELRPETVELRFVPNPSDLKLTIAGKTFRGPQTLTSWVGQDLNVGVPRQRDRDGRTWAFKSWSDGGPATRTIVAPEDPKTYTATFRRVSR